MRGQGRAVLDGQGRGGWQGGFSLAETVVAVGVVATMVLGLLAMLPLGMKMVQEGGERGAEARIKGAVAAAYQMVEWEEVEAQGSSGAERSFFFDSNGVRVAPGDREMLFEARAQVLPMQARLPGDTRDNKFLRQIWVRVAARPERPDAFGEGDRLMEFTAWVVKVNK
jgi:uncharacterized protein (TIGR02598 family)